MSPAKEIGGIDVSELRTCTCLRLRKTSRRITQIYEHHLQEADVTIGQFGVLAHLFATREAGLKVGSLADQLQVDPTTLNRTLRPLLAKSWIETRTDPTDRRVRMIAISGAGCAALETAIPVWQQAQHAMADVLGRNGKEALDHVLEGTLDRIVRAETAVADD